MEDREVAEQAKQAIREACTKLTEASRLLTDAYPRDDGHAYMRRELKGMDDFAWEIQKLRDKLRVLELITIDKFAR